MATSPKVTATEQRRLDQALADKVMTLYRDLDREGVLPYLKGDSFKKCTWRDTTRIVNDGKVSCWGNSGINDVYDVQDLGNGETYEQYVFAGDNLDFQFVPLPANKLDLLMTDLDGKTPRLTGEDGNKLTLTNALHDFGRLVGVDGAHLDVEDMADERVQYCVQFSFVEYDDINNKDETVNKRTEVRSYMSGSGADCAFLHFGGWGVNGGILQGGYGSRTKVAPTCFVDGKEHQFNLAVTPMVSATGKVFNIAQAGTEDKASAQLAASEGRSVELKVGPRDCDKLTSTLTAIVPVKKMQRPTPAPVPAPAPVYVTVDPVSKMSVYTRRGPNGAYHRVHYEYCPAAVTLGAPSIMNIVGYTPAAYGAFATAAVVTSVTNGMIGVNLMPSPGLTVALNGGLSSATHRYRSLSAPSSASAGPSDPKGPVEDDEEEEDEEEPVCYRSAKALTAGPPAVVSAAMEEEADEAEEPVLVNMADAVEEDAPADTSNDAAIAEELQKDEEASGSAPDAPMVGDKRSLSTSDRDTVPEVNMVLTRQSRGKKSTGIAPKVTTKPERSPSGSIVVTHTVTLGIKRGMGPTRQDLIEMNKIKGQLIEAAKKAAGVKSEKKLSDAYAAKMGVTSDKPLDLQAKCDIQATKEACVNAPVSLGLPVGLF